MARVKYPSDFYWKSLKSFLIAFRQNRRIPLPGKTAHSNVSFRSNQGWSDECGQVKKWKKIFLGNSSIRISYQAIALIHTKTLTSPIPPPPYILMAVSYIVSISFNSATTTALKIRWTSGSITNNIIDYTIINTGDIFWFNLWYVLMLSLFHEKHQIG